MQLLDPTVDVSGWQRHKILQARAQALTGEGLPIPLQEPHALLSSLKAPKSLGQRAASVRLIQQTDFWP